MKIASTAESTQRVATNLFTTNYLLMHLLMTMLCHSVSSLCPPPITNGVWTLTANTEVELTNCASVVGSLVIVPDSPSSIGPVSSVVWYSVVIRNSSFNAPVSIGNGSVLLKNLRVELVNVTINLTDASRRVVDDEEHVFSVLLGNDSTAPALAQPPVQGNVTIIVSGGSSFAYSGNGSNAATMLSLVVSPMTTTSCDRCTVSVTDIRNISMENVVAATVLSLLVHQGATATYRNCDVNISSSNRGGSVSVATAKGSGWLSLLSTAAMPNTIVQLTDVAIACRSLTTIAVSALSGFSTCLSIAQLAIPSNAALTANNCSVVVKDVSSVSMVEDGSPGCAALLAVRGGKENATLLLTNVTFHACRVASVTAVSSQPWLNVLSIVAMDNTRSLRCAGCSFVADSVDRLVVNGSLIGSVLSVATATIAVSIPDQLVEMTGLVFEALNVTTVGVVADAGSSLILSFVSTGAASCVNCRFSVSRSGQLTAASPNGPRGVILSALVWKTDASLFFSNVSFIANSVTTLNASSKSWATVLSAGMAVTVQPLWYESCSMTAVSVGTVRAVAEAYVMALSLFVTDGNDNSISNVTFNATNVTYIQVIASLRPWALIASIAVDTSASALVGCTMGTFLLQNVVRAEAVAVEDRLASVLSVAASDNAHGLSLQHLKMMAMFVGVINVTAQTGMTTCLSVLTLPGGTILRCVACQLIAQNVSEVYAFGDSGPSLVIGVRLTSTVVWLDRLDILASSSLLLQASTGGGTALVGSLLLALGSNITCINSQVSISDILRVIVSSALRTLLLSAFLTSPTALSDAKVTMESVSSVFVSSSSGSAFVLSMVTSGGGSNASNCTLSAVAAGDVTLIAGVGGLSLMLSVHVGNADMAQNLTLAGSDIRSVTVISVNFIAAAGSIVKDPYALDTAIVRQIAVAALRIGAVNVTVSSSSNNGSASAFSVVAQTSPMSAVDITFTVEQLDHSLVVSAETWATAFSFVMFGSPLQNVSCNASGVVFNVSKLPLLAVHSSGLWAVALSFVATSSSPGIGAISCGKCFASSENVGNHSVTAASFAVLLSVVVTEATAANFTGLTLRAAGSQSLQATTLSGNWACILSTVTNGSQSSFIGTDVMAAVADSVLISTNAEYMYSTVLSVVAGGDSDGVELRRATFQARFVSSIQVYSYIQALLLIVSTQPSVRQLACTDCTFFTAFVSNMLLDAPLGASVLSLEVHPNTNFTVVRLTMQASHGDIIRAHALSAYASIMGLTTGSVSTQVTDTVFSIDSFGSIVAEAHNNSGCVILAVRLRNAAPALATLTRCRFVVSHVSSNISARGRMSSVLSAGTLATGNHDVIALANCIFTAIDVNNIWVSGVVGAVVLSVVLLTDPSSGFIVDTNFTAIRVSRIHVSTEGSDRAAVLSILKDSTTGMVNATDSTWAAVDVGVIEVASVALYSAVLSPAAMSGAWWLRQVAFTAERVQLLNSTSGAVSVALSLVVQSVLSVDVRQVTFVASGTETVTTLSTGSTNSAASAALSILVNLSSAGQAATTLSFSGVQFVAQNASTVAVASFGASPSFALSFTVSAVNGSVVCDSCSFAAVNATVISARSETQQSAVLSALAAVVPPFSSSTLLVDLTNVSLVACNVSVLEATVTLDGVAAVMLIGASTNGSIGSVVNCYMCSALATQIGSITAVGRSDSAIGTARLVCTAASISFIFTNVSTVNATAVSGNAAVGCGMNLMLRSHASFYVSVRHTKSLTSSGARGISAGVLIASVTDNSTDGSYPFTDKGEGSNVTVGIAWQDITSVNVYSAVGSADGGCVNITGNASASVTTSVQWSSVAVSISGFLGAQSMRFHSAVAAIFVSVELCSSQLRVYPRSSSALASAFFPAGTATTGTSSPVLGAARLQRLLLHDVEVVVVNGIECLRWAPQTTAVYIDQLRLFGCELFGWRAGAPGSAGGNASAIPLPAVKAVQLNGKLLSKGAVMSFLPGAGRLHTVIDPNLSEEGMVERCGAAAWASPYSWSPTSSVATSISSTASPTMSISTVSTTATPTASLPATSSLQHCILDSCFITELRFAPNVSGAVTLGPPDAAVPAPLTAAPVGAAELQTWITGAIRAGNGTLRVGIRCGPSSSADSDYDGSRLRVAAGHVTIAGTQLSASVGSEWLPERATSLTEVVLGVGGGGATVVVPLMYWYSQQTVLVDLTAYCGPSARSDPNASTTGWMRIAVPMAPLSLPTSTATTAVVVASQWTSSVGGATASSTVGRIAVWRRLMYCESGGGPSSGGMLGVSIGWGGSDDDEAARYGRGAVVGNAGILLGAAGIALCMGLWWVALLRRGEATNTKTPYASKVYDACLRMCLPSSLLSLWAMTAPTTAEGAAWLLRRGSNNATDAFLGVVGILHLLTGWLVVVLLCFRDPHRWLSVRLVAGTEQLRAFGGGPAQVKFHVAALQLWRLLRAKWVRWKPATATTDCKQRLQTVSLTNSRLAGALLDEYHYLWFAGLELAALMVDCVIGAVSSAADGLNVAACSALGFVSLAVVSVQFVVCLTSKPFLTRLSFAYAVVTVVLAIVSRSLRLWLLSNSGELSADRVSQGITAAEAIDMMASTLGALKTIALDVPSLLLFLVRYASEIRSLLRENRLIAEPMLLVDNLDEDAVVAPMSDAVMLPLFRNRHQAGGEESRREVVEFSEGSAASEVVLLNDDVMSGGGASVSSVSVYDVPEAVVPLGLQSDNDPVVDRPALSAVVRGPASSVIYNGLIFHFEDNSSFSRQELALVTTSKLQ